MKRPYERELTTEELLRLKDEDIDYSDIPELDDSFWSSARVVMPERRNKTQITAKFDADMVSWFRAQGRGYQARMNAGLRAIFEAARRDKA
ncbi:MAG: BrnA antitoxin family protein [Rhodospirillaceae bacterium]|nr:BrnA antitoxin family protein [Rhodospirillaceae bacterium]